MDPPSNRLLANDPPIAATIGDIEMGAAQVLSRGFVHLERRFASAGEARAVGARIATAAERRSPLGDGMPALVAVGEFVVPPPGVPSREFQLLHFDFGLPIDPRRPQDVARYTVLHILLDWPETSARTRIVRLAPLLGRRKWPSGDALTDRLLEYGSSWAARDTSAGYVEGILARLVEAAHDAEVSLPGASECLCGQEFENVADERKHFARRDLRLEEAEVLVCLEPGQLLVLDNLATAHGRLGRRRSCELHQLMLGHSQLGVDLQAELRDRVLAAFSPGL